MNATPPEGTVDNEHGSPEPLNDVATRVASGRGRAIGLSTLVIGVAFMLWTVIMASGITPFVFVVAGWVLCPYLILWLTGRWISSSAAEMLLFVLLVAMTAFGVWAFSFVDEDAQGGLVLLFAPGYQLIGAIAGGLITLVVDRIVKPQ